MGLSHDELDRAQASRWLTPHHSMEGKPRTKVGGAWLTVKLMIPEHQGPSFAWNPSEALLFFCTRERSHFIRGINPTTRALTSGQL